MVLRYSEDIQKHTHPLGKDDKKTKKDKSPSILCTTFVSEVWRLFETVWENKNDCLHNPSCTPLTHIDERLNEQLIHYKRNRNSMLAYTDRHWIKLPEHVIRSWLHTAGLAIRWTLGRRWDNVITRSDFKSETIFGFLSPSYEGQDT